MNDGVKTFSNLRLGVRLGLSFASLIAALLVVGAIGFHDMDALGSDTEHLADNDVRALTVASALADRASSTAHLVAQHLYVHSDDLAKQDAIARQIAPVTGRNNADIKTLDGLVSTETHKQLESFDRSEERFEHAYSQALRRSRAETAAHAVDRGGSRAIYEKQVLPLTAEIEGEANKLASAVNHDALAQAKAGTESAASGKRDILLVALLATLFAAAVAWAVTRSVTRPVQEISVRLKSLNERCLAGLSRVLEAVAGGDLTQTTTSHTAPIEVTTRDELGQLSQTFNEMLDKAKGSIDSYDTMRRQLSDVIGSVANGAGTVSAASQEMASTSDEAGNAVTEIAAAISEVAVGADRQSRMIETTRAAVQEATRAAGASAVAAQDMSRAAEEARGVAHEGVRAAQHATDAIRQVAAASTRIGEEIEALSAKSERIGGIVTTITAIAEQTNLLALNAAIEAARAGEQGKGFAVVAEEVRKLAEESQTAASEITTLISEMQSQTAGVVGVVGEGAKRTADGVATVEQTREAFERIGDAVEGVSSKVTEIAAALEQISAEANSAEAGIQEVASVAESSTASTEEISASTQQTSASAEEIAASASELAQTAERLDQLVQKFKVA